MNRVKNKTVLITASFVSIAFILCLVFAFLSSAKARANKFNTIITSGNTASEAACHEDDAVYFTSIKEYEGYLLKQAMESGKSREHDEVTVVYWAPKALPEGVELRSIKLSNEGVVFDYACPTDSRNFVIGSDDETLNEAFTSIRTKLYDYQSYSSFVSDFRQYAHNLANCLDASLYSTASDLDIYIGDVPYTIIANGGNEQAIVGQQVVSWRHATDSVTMEPIELVFYWYWPNGLITEQIAEAIEYVPHVVRGGNN